MSLPCPGRRGEGRETAFSQPHTMHGLSDVLSSFRHPHTPAPRSSYPVQGPDRLGCSGGWEVSGRPSLTHTRSPPREWWHTCAGEPGWHPEATTALPPGRTPAILSVLPGEWASASRTARAPALDPAREGTSGLGRLRVKGCVRWGLCPPAFLAPHGAALGGTEPWKGHHPPLSLGKGVPQATETQQHVVSGLGGDGHRAGHRLRVPDHLPRPQA